MFETIKFGEGCSCWTDSEDRNMRFILNGIARIKDEFKTQKYMYQNRIYEIFGVTWDPAKANRCWVYGRDEIEIGIYIDTDVYHLNTENFIGIRLHYPNT